MPQNDMLIIFGILYCVINQISLGYLWFNLEVFFYSNARIVFIRHLNQFAYNQYIQKINGLKHRDSI